MNPTILVAEEVPYWRQAAHEALVLHGYSVAEINDYRDLQGALRECPRVALLGFTVLDERAEAAAAETRRACPNTTTVILSTSWPVRPSMVRRLFRLGVADVVSRPNDVHGFVHLVEAELP